MSSIEATSRLLTRKEVEEKYGISKRFLEISAVRGDGPPLIKIGRSARYRVADLEKWIDSRCVGGDVLDGRL